MTPVKLLDKSIIYGPYYKIPKFSYKQLSIHFLNVEPDLVDTVFERTVKVGYGNERVHINDFHELRNQGPKLKGHFSRIDAMLNPAQDPRLPVVHKITCELPPNADEVYVKDYVGNISTTNWRKSKFGSKGEFELRPRFPLFGGWKFTWWHGYDLPVEQIVKPMGDDLYSLSLDLYLRIGPHSAEKAIWKAILPEGATY